MWDKCTRVNKKVLAMGDGIDCAHNSSAKVVILF